MKYAMRLDLYYIIKRLLTHHTKETIQLVLKSAHDHVQVVKKATTMSMG